VRILKNNLKKIRQVKNISGTELAKMVKVSHTMIYMIENGTKNPSMRLAKKIAKALGTSLDKIFFDENCHEELPKEHQTV